MLLQTKLLFRSVIMPKFSQNFTVIPLSIHANYIYIFQSFTVKVRNRVLVWKGGFFPDKRVPLYDPVNSINTGTITL